jgi:hypothetical protein
MSLVTKTAPSRGDELSIRSWWSGWTQGWDRFWFRREDPTTLGLIRLLTGCVVFYAHLVWSSELLTFFGNDGVLPENYRQLLFGNDWAWSHFDLLGSPTTMWFAHVMGLVIIAMFTCGIWTRVTAVITALLVISYANRATGALFGLDQIMGFLCLYLAIGNSGGAFSVDRWLANRKAQSHKSNAANKAGQGGAVGLEEPSLLGDFSTNIAIRLIQIHMCLVYLFAGLGKLQGETWWNGQAIWYSLASYEYQTLDMTWMANHMWLVSLITLVTVAWEVSYAALVWPRLTRPFVLLLAIPLHLGIGICMGMMTFGLIMLIGNLAFVAPVLIRRMLPGR